MGKEKGKPVNKIEKKRSRFGCKPRGCEYAGSQVKERKVNHVMIV